MLVSLLVAGEQQRVKIDRTDELIAAPEFNLVQAAYLADSAGGAERVR